MKPILSSLIQKKNQTMTDLDLRNEWEDFEVDSVEDLSEWILMIYFHRFSAVDSVEEDVGGVVVISEKISR